MTTTPILQPGGIEAAVGGIPELRLPPAALFFNRAQRLHQLAEGHSLGDFLHFMAVLAECQQSQLDHHPEIPAPDIRLLTSCREHAIPPLDAASWSRHPHWQKVTRNLTKAIYEQVPSGGRDALTRLLDSNKEWLDDQADKLLTQKFENLDRAAAPIIGAALQVQWTYLARKLKSYHAAWPEQPRLCPLCDSHPVASVIRTDGQANGLRYLHCSLCNSEWHMVRSKCSNCDSTKGGTYYSIEGRKDLVSAETCHACHTYLKVIYQEKDPQVEPVADDLATLALDLLMGQKNLAKSGINLLLIQGKDCFIQN
jgi:FdhE protein